MSPRAETSTVMRRSTASAILVSVRGSGMARPSLLGARPLPVERGRHMRPGALRRGDVAGELFGGGNVRPVERPAPEVEEVLVLPDERLAQITRGEQPLEDVDGIR